MTDDEKQRETQAIIARHLQQASAAERHIYVARSNYDDNLPHLSWLADQSDLDLATAVMMFWFGSGPIKGFAVVLIIGIITSVFTAVTVTRLLVSLWLRRARPQQLVL